MSEQNGTGVQYPEITLGGVLYTVKFTRGTLLYRLSRIGTDIATVFTQANFSKMIDLLHAAITPRYIGTPEDLAELVVSEDKSAEVGRVVAEALGKVFPPTKAPAPVDQQTEARPN